MGAEARLEPSQGPLALPRCLDWDSGEAACLRGGLCISESGTWTRGGKKRRGSWEKGLEGASLGPGGLGLELSVMRQKWGA